jgi:phosphatidylserine/phosphatidylglycerophosphate/cardiolipin synthase-like enzyme
MSRSTVRACIALLLGTTLAPLAHATPEADVNNVLTTKWGAEAGSTWEVTNQNALTSVLFTPIGGWGLSQGDMSYAVYEDDTHGLNLDGVGRMVRCSAPSPGRTNACPTIDPVGGHLIPGNTGHPISRCMTLDIFRSSQADAPVNLCASQSDQMLEDVWTMVASARRTVDLTTLFPPSGRFTTTLANAITFAANEMVRTNDTGTLTIRILVGEQHVPARYTRFLQWLAPKLPTAVEQQANELLQQSSDPEAVLDGLGLGDLSPEAARKIRIYVGVYHPSISVWNHAKILAVDGREALVGGHNLWDAFPYFDTTPVHDLSLRVSGPAALSAHKFAQRLWGVVCAAPGSRGVGNQMIWTWDTTKDEAELLTTCPTALTGANSAIPPSPTPGAARIYAVGRLGTWLGLSSSGSGKNPADDAIAAMIRAAQQNVIISQQDLRGPRRFSEELDYHVRELLKQYLGETLGNFVTDKVTFLNQMTTDYLSVQGAWMEPVLRAIADAAAHDRKVHIIIPDEVGVASPGYSSSGADAVLQTIMRYWPGAPTGATKSDAQLRCNIEVVHVRQFDDTAGTGYAPGSHVKMVMVDPGLATGGVYVGSQNLYDHELAEFGYLIFDQASVQAVFNQYANPAWTTSATQNGVDQVHRWPGC